MKKQDETSILPRMRVWIRLLYGVTIAAWLGLWLVSALGDFEWNPMLWAAMLLQIFFCTLLNRLYQMAMARQSEAEELRQTLAAAERINRELRARRHDVINHLQVVYSLLQLGDTAEALSYLEDVNQDFISARAVLRTGDPAVNALLSAKKLQGENRGFSVEFDVQTDLTELPMESWEFCRILGNLLDNAMDATGEAGRIALRLWTDEVGIHFSVINSGDGIPEAIREKIFAAGFTTKGDRGTGMGLFIVKSLVEGCGGRISVSSEGGQTCFAGYVPRRS